ncbi:MAG: hypothetical protein J6U25_00895 [Clostridia bacterium]|nr:hypothetical protein [Clostridia bacterium]
MRKKAIMAQNLSLFEQLEKLRGECALKDKKIKDLEERIKELSEKTETPVEKADTPLKKLEEKVISGASLKPDVEYASEVIGKLVLESANGSNMLTAGGGTEHRELVNLLLGKTEVAKAEILSIVSETGDFEDKKVKIDAVKDEALDYFSSVLGQVN